MKNNLPEIIFGSSDKAQSQRISRGVRSGNLRKLIPRVYTSNLEESDETIISRNLYLILGGLFPGAVMSHRTALEGGPTESGDLFLTYGYSKKVTLPGLCVHLLKGPEATEQDMPFVAGLFMSSPPRAFLENFQISHSRSSTPKTLPKAALEERLDQIVKIQGADALNELRDKARTTARALQMETPFQKLNKTISAILRTRPARELSSPQARATSQGRPYDPHRLHLFNRLFSTLMQSNLPIRRERNLSEKEFQTRAFFEAYFSNYIEGTEFEISEAYDIVFKNKVSPERPQDTHDILGTYRIVANRAEMQKGPDSFDSFLTLLKTRHHTIQEARTDKHPGEFKTKPNRAGETQFTDPELVMGTLLKGFEMLQAVPPGLSRAIFTMFLVAEVHPFDDGNGRIARIMMNADLAHDHLCRIIVPTVFRDDYLLALRALSRTDNPEPLIKTMAFAQQFSAEVDFSSYENALRILTRCNAFREPEAEARLRLPSTLHP